RRLRENRGLAQARSALAVMLGATLEVRKAVIFATFSVVLIFLPILHLSGVAGRLFRPLALAYIFAILSSLAVALTVAPALAHLLLGHAPLDPADPPLLARAKRSYSRMLAFVDRHPRAVFAAVAVLVLGGLASVPALRTSFLPQFNENDLIVHFETAPGT
ncbi:Acriflavin resistance protein, partial [mine drainage metagenome]